MGPKTEIPKYTCRALTKLISVSVMMIDLSVIMIDIGGNELLLVVIMSATLVVVVYVCLTVLC